jgi:hypothetical protein
MIDMSVSKYIEDLGLDVTPLGMGQLLLTRVSRSEPAFVIEDPLSGNGVSDLSQSTGIICYPDDEFWLYGAEVVFSDAMTALQWLAKPDFRAALLSVAADAQPTDELRDKFHAEVIWSDNAKEQMGTQSSAEFARQFFEKTDANGVDLVQLPG